jgi:Xaa-Pro aminopeptidase
MDYKRRIALLKDRIKASGLDSFLVTDDTNVAYLSGFSGHDSLILVTPKKTFFITDSRYIQEARKSLDGFTVELASSTAYVAVREIAKASGMKRLGFESMDIPYAAATRLKDSLAGIKFIAINSAVEELREVKEPAEVRSIIKSIALAKTVFRKTLSLIRPGATEQSLARYIETEFLKKNARTAFDPIVAAGANSSKPHAVPGPARIRNNSFVMIDMGCRLRGYCSDMTRTVLLGAMKDKFAEIYTVVREAQKRAIGKIRSGVRISEVDFAARGYIHSKGYGKYFGHSVGHGVGMKVHELPSVSRISKDFLKKGMITTIEPAIYIPGFGGVRIEDMVLVTDKGCEILT